MRISDWSSDVCSSDLPRVGAHAEDPVLGLQHQLHVVADVVGHQGRQPDPEVAVRPVRQLCGRPRRPLLTTPAHPRALPVYIGSASLRESGCQYVSIWVVAVYLNKNQLKNQTYE